MEAGARGAEGKSQEVSCVSFHQFLHCSSVLDKDMPETPRNGHCEEGFLQSSPSLILLDLLLDENSGDLVMVHTRDDKLRDPDSERVILTDWNAGSKPI